MRLYSTKNKTSFVTLGEAVLKGLPDDNGLFMPENIPQLPPSFFEKLDQLSFQEISYEVASLLFQDAIPQLELKAIIDNAITFPAPVVRLDESTYILELFHGPSLAFKDFGARFMSNLMSYLNRGNDKELVILVATSGDTGGAVASGFHNTPGINIVILYPSEKVSELQEKQLTTLGGNVMAIEVLGNFDDCQSMVKQAFLDNELNKKIRLSSANSINIARLIPQSFYYFEAYKQLPKDNRPVVFSVPSGNFGNLSAGLIAKKMGLNVHHFIAATNANDIVPQYLSNGIYNPKTSVPTLSNAMDVGNPSNFPRMLDIYGSTWNNIAKDLIGYAYDDFETEKGMKHVFEYHNYVIDPHGAIGYLALKEYQKKQPNTKGVVLETAHPSKFLPDVERILNKKIEIPERLSNLKSKEKKSTKISVDYRALKQFLLKHHNIE